METLYTVKDYAALFKVDIETVYRWVKNGQVQYVRHGKIIRIIKND